MTPGWLPQPTRSTPTWWARIASRSSGWACVTCASVECDCPLPSAEVLKYRGSQGDRRLEGKAHRDLPRLQTRLREQRRRRDRDLRPEREDVQSRLQAVMSVAATERRQHMRTANLVTILTTGVAVVVAAGAYGSAIAERTAGPGQAQAKSSPAPAAVDACTLLTKEEAVSAVGEGLDSAKSS